MHARVRVDYGSPCGFLWGSLYYRLTQIGTHPTEMPYLSTRGQVQECPQKLPS